MVGRPSGRKTTDGPWPVVVAGSGGSGTRLLVAILRAAGVYMGTKVNPTEDALAFRSFNQQWLRPYLKHRRGKLPTLDHARMAADFQQSLADHRADLAYPPQPWGWKRPESIYVLPFLHQQLPDLTFLHVIRNGLDMAFSSNQNDLLRYGEAVLGRTFDHEPQPLRSLRLWTQGNVPAADFGESCMGPRYLRVPYEDLCAQPTETIAAVFARLGLSADPRAAAALVVSPGTIGRWRSQPDAQLLVRLLRVGEPALKRFNYWDESAYRKGLMQVGRVRLALFPLDDLASRARLLAGRFYDLLSRVERAARERRLRAALRNRLARWISPGMNRQERLL